MAEQAGAPRLSPAKLALMFAAGLAAMLALVFLPAGRLDWVGGWVYVGVLAAGAAVNFLALRRLNPELIARRTRAGAGTKAWDRPILGVFRLTTFAILVVGGLDAGRFGWSVLPAWTTPLGAALVGLGYGFTTWAMVVNGHFEGTVRIQTDRGHAVVDRGPYGFVRHPGYVGFLAVLAASPLVLGSAWAFVPAGAAVAALVLRTALEDRTLRAELAGYEAYASRVRHRLVPGLW